MNRLSYLLMTTLMATSINVYASNNNSNNDPKPEVRSNVVQNGQQPFCWERQFNQSLINREDLKQTQQLTVLSFDGGGIIGILGAHNYAVADKVAFKLTGKSIQDFIHIYAGTSTGGIFAIAATLADEKGLPKLSSIDLYRLYLYYGPLIFKKSVGNHFNIGGIANVKYDATYLEELLQHFCNLPGDKQAKFKNATKPTFITAYSTSSDKRILFDSTNSDQVRQAEAWQIARSTSAAPTFFNPYKMDVHGKEEVLVDGGVWENDPSLKVLKALKEKYDSAYGKLDRQDLCFIKLVSFGAGFVKLKATEEMLKDKGIFSVLGPLMVSLFNAREKDTEESNLAIAKNAPIEIERNTHGLVLNSYERFQIELEEDVKALDNVKPQALRHLVEKAKDQCASDRYKAMLSDILGVSIQEVSRVLEAAIEEVDREAASVNLSANHYFDHLAWIHEYIYQSKDDSNYDVRKYLSDKLHLGQEETAQSALQKAKWLSHFLNHNLQHNKDKTWWSSGKEMVREGMHMEAQEEAFELYRALFLTALQDAAKEDVLLLCTNQAKALNEFFDQSGILNNYGTKFREQMDASIKMAALVPEDIRTTYLNELLIIVNKSKESRSKVRLAVKDTANAIVSGAKKITSLFTGVADAKVDEEAAIDSWHDQKIAEINKFKEQLSKK